MKLNHFESPLQEGISLQENSETNFEINLVDRYNSTNWAKPNRHSIRKNWAMLVCFVIALFAFTTCGNDDDTSSSNKSVPDPEGTILVAMRNSNNGTTYVTPDGCNSYFCIYNDNFAGDFTFATIGKLSGLGNITSIPTNGWANQVAVLQGYGYVAKYEYQGQITYVRIYVDSYLTSTSGGIMGANVKYQSPFKP